MSGTAIIPDSAQRIEDPLPIVRRTVQRLLLSSPAYLALDPPSRRKIAGAMVKVCHTAASLVREEIESAQELAPAPKQLEALAVAQSAGRDFSGVAASRVAATTQSILNAVSFPRFVTDLINGVFKAMIDSSVQQMNSYVELLNNVAASSEGFADANLGPDRARQWLVEQFPGSFTIDTGSSAGDIGSDGPPQATVTLRDGASMPSAAALRTVLGMEDGDSVPAGDPEQLVPLVRVRLARLRQQMLSTMVMLGMQRIVVESGKINASMHFHIDTRSAAQDDEGSRFDFKNQLNAAGNFGTSGWGVSASMQNTIGYVSTQRSQTTEEMNTDLDLNSSVEINFKSDYLPLNRLAGPGQVNRITENSINPQAEQAALEARAPRAAQSDLARRTSLDNQLVPPVFTAPEAGATGTPEAAQRNRERSEASSPSGPAAARNAAGGTPAAGSGATAGSGGGGTNPPAATHGAPATPPGPQVQTVAGPPATPPPAATPPHAATP